MARYDGFRKAKIVTNAKAHVAELSFSHYHGFAERSSIRLARSDTVSEIDIKQMNFPITRQEFAATIKQEAGVESFGSPGISSNIEPASK